MHWLVASTAIPFAGEKPYVYQADRPPRPPPKKIKIINCFLTIKGCMSSHTTMKGACSIFCFLQFVNRGLCPRMDPTCTVSGSSFDLGSVFHCIKFNAIRMNDNSYRAFQETQGCFTYKQIHNKGRTN